MSFEEGDEVYAASNHGQDLRKARVTRVTKTQAMVTSASGVTSRYRRDTGRLVGSSTWDTACIYHRSPDLDARYDQQVLRTRLRAVSVAALNLDRGLSSPSDLREAFQKWDALERELNS